MTTASDRSVPDGWTVHTLTDIVHAVRDMHATGVSFPDELADKVLPGDLVEVTVTGPDGVRVADWMFEVPQAGGLPGRVWFVPEVAGPHDVLFRVGRDPDMPVPATERTVRPWERLAPIGGRAAGAALLLVFVSPSTRGILHPSSDALSPLLHVAALLAVIFSFMTAVASTVALAAPAGRVQDWLLRLAGRSSVAQLNAAAVAVMFGWFVPA